MADIIQTLQFKRGLKATLEALLVGANKPQAGEPVWESDTNKLKIGNGTQDYIDLPYFAPGGGGEPDQYIKSAELSGNSLVLTKKDGTTVTYTPDYSTLATKTELESEASTREQADTALQTEIDGKSTVTASATGTSTTEVGYITIDGTEYKLPSGGSGSSAEAISVDITTEDDPITKINEAYTAAGKTPKKGDIGIARVLINAADTTKGIAEHRQYTAYVHDGEGWSAMDGNYNAENVYFAKDIIYTKAIGELPEVPTTGSATLAAKGKNVKQIFDAILAQRKQPSVIDPQMNLYGKQNDQDVEIGTSISKSGTFQAELTSGSYTYGPETGVRALSWSGEVSFIEGKSGTIATVSSQNTPYSYSLRLGTDGETVTVKFHAVAPHNEGVIANDNLGDPSNPVKRITAGTTEKSTMTKYTCYRKMFYGTRTDKTDLDSAKIRALGSQKTRTGSLAVQIFVGAMRTVIAVPESRTITSIKDRNGMGAEILSSFSTTTVAVEGAEGYTAANYKVYYLDYAEAIEKANYYDITIA